MHEVQFWDWPLHSPTLPLLLLLIVEGWKREPTKYQVAQEAPVTFADPTHENWEEEGRVSKERGQGSCGVRRGF
jgi:hypothetical protein